MSNGSAEVLVSSGRLVEAGRSSLDWGGLLRVGARCWREVLVMEKRVDV